MIKKKFALLIILFLSILIAILLIQLTNKYIVKEKQNYFYSKKIYKIPSFIYATKKSINTIVSIKSYNLQTLILDPFSEELFNFNFYKSKIKTNYIIPSGIGSGIIISPNGYIITNNHVIDKSSKLEVILNNQKSCIAKIIGKDPNTDIALIKINEINLPFLNFSNSDQIQIGEWVLAIGNPFGLTSTITAGIVSAKTRTLNILRSKSNSPIESFIQTDAVINPGNSGGALLNINGNLIGINTAISSQTGTYIGYGFAIPSNLAKKSVEDIQKFGVVQRGYLGVYTLDLTNNEQITQYNQIHKTKLQSQEGIIIMNVVAKSTGEYGGLKKEDIIVKINQHKIKSYGTLCLAIANKNPGDIITIEILRKNKKKIYNIVLQESKEKNKLNLRKKINIIKILGADLEILTIQQKINFGIQYGFFIKKINEIKFNNIGFEEGIILITINKKLIYSYNKLYQMLQNCKSITQIEYLDPYGRLINKKCNYKLNQ